MIDITSFWTVALLAFLGSYLALLTLRPFAVSVGLVDRVGILKLHGDSVPMIGGLAILIGYCFVLAVHPILLQANIPFLICGGLIVVMGTLDDRFLLSPMLRLSVQIVVALIAIFSAGLMVDNIGAPFLSGVIELHGFAIPFAILVFVGGINAWNMIDGIDGLASVLAFIALGFLLAVAGSSGPALQASLLALLCSISAFFLFNLPFRGLRRHRTFLGDAGSTFLGFAVVWHALALSQNSTAVISPITALWFVALPVYDVITTTLRRVLKGVSPLAGDRQHLHHLLQDHGLSIRQTLLVMASLALLGGMIGISSHYAGVSDSAMFALYVWLGAVYFLGVRRLAAGHARHVHGTGMMRGLIPDMIDEDRPAGMKISVITVCFNAAETIADTIQSIRCQSHSNIEYIVVDGGSTDGTLAIIAQNRDVISVLVTGPDNGMYDAANKGINAASGTIVGMLNADDFYADKDVLRDVADSFTKGRDAVYGDLHYVDRERPEKIKRNWVSGLYRRQKFLLGWMPPHPTFFIRKSAYDRFGTFRSDLKSAADYELMLRMLYKHCLKPAYIDRVLVKMRVGGKSNVSLANRIRANREDRKAWNINGLKPAWYTLYFKPLSKIGQYGAGLGFVGDSTSDKFQRSLGRVLARGEDDETTAAEPFAPVQGQGSAGGTGR